jgi:imidazolonepropionase-like amidohydrolase
MGLSPADVLIAAMREGSEVMERSSELGHLTPGYRADLLVLEAIPLLDIRNARRIALVMQDGRFVHCVLARLSTSCPE